MNTGWWLTFLVHIFIIIIHWIIKKPIHFFITLIVVLFFLSQFFLLYKTSIKNGNFTFFNNYHFCYNNEIKPEKKYIIFRLDDIQSSYLNDLSIKMLNEGLKRKIPFTLAVIPLNLSEDSRITTYLKQNKCNIEIAQHWFNNRDDVPEFQSLSEKAANQKLEDWLKILKKYTNKEIITFIPPNNVYSTGTVISAQKNKFKIISSEWAWFFDYSTSTYDYEFKKMNTVSSIVKKSIEDSNNKWFSIIMLHPQDYIDEVWNIDPIKYNEYIKLLDSLQEQWFSFTTMSDYYNYLRKQWLKTTFFDSSIKIPEFNNNIIISENYYKG